MSFDYVRRLVSGNKARFKDAETAIELDLVYVTDRIIIMGYPAVGFSALYRNRRRDVLTFINSRHGDKWWIWNLCPLYENAYAPEDMYNRVSRYPFPDHHPPPLPLLPLAVREMTAWLEGDNERIAIIHCKAGKGRSGTLLCSYLLSLSELPPPPQLDRSYTEKEMLRRQRDRRLNGEDSEPEGWIVVGGGAEYAELQVASSEAQTPAGAGSIDASRQPFTRSTNSSMTTISQPSGPPSINIPVSSNPSFEPIAVGDEDEPSAQGQRDRLDGKVDSVFKLHSSRRMKPTSSGRGVSIPSQRRWCRYVNLLLNQRAPPTYLSPGRSRVSLKSVTMTLHPASGWKKPLASIVWGSGGAGKAWASVARYDDGYVTELRRRGGDGQGVSKEVVWGGIGGNGEYDKLKMFRSCGKLAEDEGRTDEQQEDGLHVHHLNPQSPDGETAIILDTDREFRLKLHLGRFPLGWLWMIPAFHLPTGRDQVKRTHRLTFSRTQIDFPLGPGQLIHEISIEFEDLDEDDRRATARLMTSEEEERTGLDDGKGEPVKEEGE